MGNVILVAVSLAVAVLLSEAGARLFLNPADYLSATTVEDEILGIRIAPGAAGFDAWGFRNRSVPSTARIVAIGDSHTYGNNARMADSWPSVLGSVTGWTVYNLGLGGYGPNQYYHLLMTRALKLKPRWIVCGLYMGDDFENAFLMSYGRDHWASLRRERWGEVDADIWEASDPVSSWHGRARTWLSRNSVIYRLVVHGPVLGSLKAAVQIRRGGRGQDPSTASIRISETGVEEAFRPLGIRDRLDQNSAAVREGMRVTFELLGRMDKACHEHGCQLVVVLIPTKESVFAERLSRDPQMHLGQAIADLVMNETRARESVLAFLARAGIPHVDTLPALRLRTADGLYTRSDRDMHPGPNGYRVIGEAVAEFFRQK